MKFSKNLGWLKESDEDDNLLADDELDTVEEEMNEGLYVDPSNYDKHDDLVDVVDKAGNPQKMTQATYDKNKDSGEFEKKEPEKKEQKIHSIDDIDDKFLDNSLKKELKKAFTSKLTPVDFVEKYSDTSYEDSLSQMQKENRDAIFDLLFSEKDAVDTQRLINYYDLLSEDYNDKDSSEFEKKEPEEKEVKAGEKVEKEPAPKDMSSDEIQKMTQNYTKLINDSILTKEGKNAVKDSFDKTGRVYVTFKNDYGDDVRAFWRKDDDGIIRREMFNHHKPISGNDYWSRDIEDDNEYYFNDIDEFIDEMSAELEYDENMKIYV